MKDKPFALVGVNSDSVERAKQAIEKNQLNWRSFQNQEEGRKVKISQDWAVQGWPTIVVLDDQFRVQYRGHSGDAATEVAKKLVDEMQMKKGE